MSIWEFCVFCIAAIVVGAFMFVIKRCAFDKEKVKIKTKYVSAFFVITSLLNTASIICYAVFSPLSLMPIIISAGVFIVDVIFLFFCLWSKLDVTSGIAYLIIASVIIGATFYMILSQSLSHEHTVVYDYEIFILEDEIVAEYDESVQGFEAFIEDTAKEMKKYNSSFHTGSVAVEYTCHYPLIKDHKENCNCTDREICSECKEYLVQRASLKEIEH